MRIKTSDLSGAALDWAVAQCEGDDSIAACYYEDNTPLLLDEAPEPEWKPSTNWAQGGPIIERYCINLFRLDPKTEDNTNFWVAHIDGIYCRYGVSALMAAMRCYVASKLGDEVEIPDELSEVI
jgi:hypothetical protein